jgi:hypothetical protein
MNGNRVQKGEFMTFRSHFFGKFSNILSNPFGHEKWNLTIPITCSILQTDLG